MQKQTSLLALLFSLFATAAARGRPPKYRHWFPKYEQHWADTLSGQCATQLEDYYENNHARCSTICACVADCLLANSSETVKANLASGAIILGLTPGILTLLGPSITELGLLSTRYPFLTILLSLASPATNISQRFRGPEGFEEVLNPTTSVCLQKWHKWLARQSAVLKMAVLALQLLLAGGMLANNIHVSLYLDYRSVSGVKCSRMYMPLIWSLISLVVHSLGMVAVHIRRFKQRGAVAPNPPSCKQLQSFFPRRWGIFRFIFEASGWETLVRSRDGEVGELLFWFASLASIVHMIFGVLVFSSIMFVSALDAVPVLTRYAVSAGICQAILIVKLAELRLDLAHSESTT